MRGLGIDDHSWWMIASPDEEIDVYHKHRATPATGTTGGAGNDRASFSPTLLLQI
jgi:hypothetical protein